MAVLAQRQNQPDLLMKQQQQEEQEHVVWQQEGIKTWAAMAAQRIIEQLRDNEGNPLPSQTLSDMHHSLTAYLNKRCTTQAGFDKRRIMAAAVGELLQYVPDLRFTATQAKILLTFGGGRRASATATHAIAILNQLQQLNGGNKQKAVRALAAAPIIDLLPARYLSKKVRVHAADQRRISRPGCHHGQQKCAIFDEC